MSESDGSTLADVIPRWLGLCKKLAESTRMYPTLMGNFMSPTGKFQKRSMAQLGDVHFAAMLLMPSMSSSHFLKREYDRALKFVLGRTPNLAQRTQISASFIEFRARSGTFARSAISAIHTQDPALYWKSYVVDGSTQHVALARIAVRMFEAVANSVASERAFSAMNLIHSKMRNRLGTEKANKQIFIYINQRVLDKKGGIFFGDSVNKTPKDQVQLEKELLEILGKDDEEEIVDDDEEPHFQKDASAEL